MGTKKRKCFNLVAVGLALASGLVLTGANGTVASADSVKTGYKSSDDYLVQHGIYTLGATDATIEVGSVNATSILSATHAIATNVLASEIPMQSPNIQVILKQSNVKDVPGQYKVTLGIAEDPELEKTVTITVVDEKKDVGQNGIYSLTANDVVFSIGQANEQTIIAQSGAQAKTTAGIPLEIIIKKSDVKSSEVGDYKVVLGINEDPTISITINVKIVGTEGEKPSTKVIRAYDAVVEAGHIDDNLILSSANAAVINPVTGMEVIETPVYIKSSTVEDKAGVYSVVLGAKGDSSVPEKTIQVTVLGNSSGGGETNPDTPIPSPWMIRAYDATVETGQIDDNSILSAANAMVINAVTGMTIDTPYIKSSTIEDKPGTYTVVLDAKGGYSSVPDKTIQVTVLGNSSEGGETNPDTPIPSPWMIRAYDATVETGQIDDNSILSAANAMVINAVTGMTIDTPYIKSSTIEDKPGTYTVVLDAKGGYSSVPDKTIQVTVLGNSSEGGETNPDTPIPSPWMIRAYDATVETGQIDDNSILSAANAMVINAVTGMTIDTPYIKSSTIEDKPGTYTVVLDAKGGYSSVPDKTIQVTVLGNSGGSGGAHQLPNEIF
ncbi:hypothetical protein IGK15_001771 [Enterococcus sp. AZ045]|uniref:hypothetical protein n=1 Tax=Enterococcus sp. AZ045 TaxID=2774807 RepID=UPI003F2778AF